MNLKDLSAKHPYYCSDHNYYSNDARNEYNSWEDFFAEWGDSDVEYNHVFRFDLRSTKGEREEFIAEYGDHYLEVFFMLQRKGLFRPVVIKNIKEEDTEAITKFLEKHWKETQKIWKPFSK